MLEVLTCITLLAPQDPLEAMRALDKIEIRGAVAFEAEAIRAALRRDGDTWRQLANAPTPRMAVRAIADKVREGYLRAGHRDVTVEAVAEGKGFVLAIEEGPALSCGAVRVSGSEAIDASALAAALATKTEGFDGWVDGAAASCDEATLQKAVAALQRAYQDRGRHGAKAVARVERQGERLHLLVNVFDEGREVRAGRLELVGEREEERAAVLERLGAKPGQPYSTAFASDLRQRLEQLGRYRTIRLPEGSDHVDGRLDPFRVLVVLEPKAPPLAKVDWNDLEQMRRARTWLQQKLQRGACLRADLELAEPLSWKGLVLGPGRVTFCFGRDGLLASTQALAIGSRPAGPCVLAMAHDGVRFSLGKARGVFAWESMVKTVASLMPSSAPDSTLDVRWGVGWTTKGRNPEEGFEVQIPDTCLSLLLHAPDIRVARERDRIVLRAEGDDGPGLLIHADGSITGRVVPKATEAWSISVDTRTLPEIESSLLPDGPRKEEPLVAFMAARAAELDFATPEQAGLREAGPLLTALCRHVVATCQPAKQRPDRARFPLVTAPGDGTQFAQVMQAWLHEVGEGVQAADWAGTCLLALPDLLLGTPVARLGAVGRMNRQLGATEPGPIAFLIQTAFLSEAGFPEAARRHAAKGLERMSFERALADVRAIAPEGSSIAGWLQGLGAYWRSQPELRETFAGIEQQGPAGDRAAFELGLRRLWDVLLQRLVASSLEAHSR